VNVAIPDSPNPGPTVTVTMPQLPGPVPGTIQVIEVEVNLTHTWRGDLNFTLTSPSGTQTVLLPTGSDADSADNLFGWSFTSFFNMGENAGGQWKLTVNDGVGGDIGILQDWKLNIYGVQATVGGTADSFTVPEDTTLNVPAPGVLVNDTNANTATIISGPSNASVFILNSNGSFTYRGKQDYNGPDSFTYRPSNGAV